METLSPLLYLLGIIIVTGMICFGSLLFENHLLRKYKKKESSKVPPTNKG